MRAPTLPVVTVADLISPPLHLHTLLTAFQLGGASSWSADLAFALQLSAAGLYLLGVRRLARRGRRWSVARTLAFMSGLVVLFVAVDSGLASYDDSNFTAHVLQHLLFMMVAPPLLSLGGPVTLALQALPRRSQSRLARALHSRTVRWATAPLLVASLYYASMWVAMESSFYPLSLRHPLVHDASHLAMFTLGCLFWWPVVGRDEIANRPHPGVRFAMLALGMPFESFLAIALMSVTSPVAPEHTLADTRAGGSIFWIGAMTVTAVAVLVAAVAWMRSDEREAVRADRRPSAVPADDDAWAAAWQKRTGSVPVLSDTSRPAG